MKNTFYITLKALFVLRIFKFLSWLFDHVEKRLELKDKFISKFMTLQPGKQMQCIYWTISQELKGIRQWNLFSC